MKTGNIILFLILAFDDSEENINYILYITYYTIHVRGLAILYNFEPIPIILRSCIE